MRHGYVQCSYDGTRREADGDSAEFSDEHF
jgi:hypothetical protein